MMFDLGEEFKRYIKFVVGMIAAMAFAVFSFAIIIPLSYHLYNLVCAGTC